MEIESFINKYFHIDFINKNDEFFRFKVIRISVDFSFTDYHRHTKYNLFYSGGFNTNIVKELFASFYLRNRKTGTFKDFNLANSNGFEEEYYLNGASCNNPESDELYLFEDISFDSHKKLFINRLKMLTKLFDKYEKALFKPKYFKYYYFI